MSAFSRLQLAAALLEYDNDPDDPNPERLAENSAIFSHIRTREGPRARTLSGFEHLRETPNLLGVELPGSETASARGSMDARRSLAGTRNSRGSIDVLRNPFGDDIPESDGGGAEEEEYEEDDLEVDLEAWGMADFLGNKGKQSSKNRRTGPRERKLSKAQSEILPNAYSQAYDADDLGPLEPPRHRHQGGRSQSMGGLGSGHELLEAMRGGPIASEADFRRRSIAAPLDPTGRKTPDFERPLSATGFKQPFPNRVPLRSHPLNSSPHTIPFPSASPDLQDEAERLNSFALPLSSSTSRFDPKAGLHTRAISNASVGSHPLLEHGRERTMSSGSRAAEDNPFALPPPTTTSRFDPRAPSNARPISVVSLGGQSILDQRERVTSFVSIGSQGLLDENNPFSLPAPSPIRTSRFDPKAAAHTRTMSNASLGSRLPPDADHMSVASNHLPDQDQRQPRRYSRMELMRPKILIMPSPLQDSENNGAPAQLPQGFQMSTVGPPLPPGAKSTGRPFSHLMPPAGSDSFTPNPRVSMSLSQLTFRNSLMLGGQRDVAYEDIESGLHRAREDGEQIIQEEDIEEEIAEEQKQAQGKAPGKLYGRSLMDELEARKQKMKSKQRVFTGDQRPTMMSRGQIRRSSTLIDPATLQDRPVSQAFGDRPPLQRRNSSGPKPLLDFSGEEHVSPGAANGRILNGKSVFGVDQLWVRELAKLKDIEAAEKAEEEARKRKDEEKAAKAAKKAKNRGKGNNKLPPPSPVALEAVPPPYKVSERPPTLPAIPKATARRTLPPVIPDSNSDTDSQASENAAKANAARRGSEAGGWGSPDDEGGRQPNQNFGSSDSEDDVPLVRKLQMPTIRAVRAPSPDSEDEKPLAKVLERKSMLPDFSFDNVPHATQEDAEEDDVPLAVRHPRAHSIIARSVTHGDDDDDDEKPLGLKQAQQQKQLNIMAQQQMMMQAQLHSSMAFGAPSMLNGFPPFMVPPPTFSAAPGPPLHDPAKYQSVDQWRHNVAAD
ncbi:hypothetical protein JB92DRAFT_916945 [Gautieria morchelliformis]|nr:hypothetical protein JB92DRAFT_916945 [Gautieria morchelliformis]